MLFRSFKFLRLKQLVATCYKHPDIDDSSFEHVSDKPIKWVYNGEQIEGQNYPDLSKAIVTNLEGDGDFRSEECLTVLKECDIIVTNPPFSLFRDLIDVIVKYDKKFMVIGNQNAITYKDFFPLLRDNKCWLGYNTNKSLFFEVPNEYYLSENSVQENKTKFVKVPAISWFTNLEHDKRNEEIILFKKYNETDYPYFDNYNAINIDKVKDIPCNYKGWMGVPITFMNKYNPKQFEIFGIMNTGEENIGIRLPNTPHGRPVVKGKEKYLRILVRNRKPQLD